MTGKTTAILHPRGVPMKATEANLLQFLKKSPQFVIPDLPKDVQLD